MKAVEVKKELKKLSSKQKAETSAWFFKTGKGQYGEGDVFIGVTVPEQRRVAKRFFAELSFSELSKLLTSKIHEHRFTALKVLVFKYEQAETENKQKECVDFYLKHLKWVNNWDLVDTSAYWILGAWLSDKKNKRILYTLARSKNMWESRVVIVATYAFIKQGIFTDTLNISEMLLNHQHDLIHKAVGWMLREVGKKDLSALETFLKTHYKTMPRTMLRYAIERLPNPKRKKYLYGEV